MLCFAKSTHCALPAQAGIQMIKKVPHASGATSWFCPLRGVLGSGLRRYDDLTVMASTPPLIMKLAMPVSPYPTFPRKREKGQTNRFASFTLTGMVSNTSNN
jgi:hypothetical protein